MKRFSLPRLLVAVTAVLFSLSATAEKKKDIYMFGVATDFIDSVAYVTTIQQIDSAILQRGTDFLLGRSLYSVQLKKYAESQLGKLHEVPALFFSTDKGKLEKKYNKVLKNIKKDTPLFLQVLSENDFRFAPVSKEQIIEQGHLAPAPSPTGPQM